MQNKNHKKKFKFSDIVIGFVFTLFFISIGVVFALNFRPLYYFDIDYLNIPGKSGYDRELIKRNYDILIDYNSPFYKGDLEFKDLPSSPQGLQHFVEVKDIFTAFYYIAFITLFICLVIIIYKHKKKDYTYLNISSIVVVLVPIVFGIIAATNFDKAFVIFHQIFFNNDYWVFDSNLDPVIKILPQDFFLHCLILILIIILLGSISLFIAYKLLNKKNRMSKAFY